MSNRVIDYGSDGKVFTIQSNGTESFFIPVYPTAAPQSLSGAGAVNVTSYFTAVTTTGANALTLAAGTVKGQMKKIQLTVDAGDGTLTIANPVSAATDTIVFSNIGDTAELIWDGTAWAHIALYNEATAAITTPTIA